MDEWKIIAGMMAGGWLFTIVVMVSITNFYSRKCKRLKKERDIYMMRIEVPPGRYITKEDMKGGSEIPPPGHPDRPSLRPLF